MSDKPPIGWDVPGSDPLDYSIACALGQHDECEGGCRCSCHDGDVDQRSTRDIDCNTNVNRPDRRSQTPN